MANSNETETGARAGAAPAAAPPPATRTPTASAAEQRRRDRRALVWVAVAVTLGMLGAQAFLVFTLLDASDELGGLRDDVNVVADRIGIVEARVDELRGALGDVEAGVGSVGQRLGALEAAAAGAASDGLSPAPDVQVDGPTLPRFDPNAPSDPAIGTVISELGSVEFYSGDDMVLDLTDGKARAILVWAHWCPFCQEELPPLAQWHATTADAFPNFELISITTAIDPAADNPLVPYLEASAFPFPVLIDSSGELSAQLGANAFPFWVFTNKDGTVLGRIAGVLGVDQFADLAAQLDAVEPVPGEEGTPDEGGDPDEGGE